MEPTPAPKYTFLLTWRDDALNRNPHATLEEASMIVATNKAEQVSRALRWTLVSVVLLEGQVTA